MEFVVFLAPMLFGAAALTVAGGSVWVAAKWVGSRKHSNDEVREAIERLADEVAELHERVDFHERLLEQVRDASRLKPGG
jgi:membrane protein implicated in regulation of membrane protease activity